MRTVLCALCALLGAGAVRAADPPPLPTVLRSASGRFAVEGGGRDARHELLEWAEVTTERFERLTGRPLDLPGNVPVRLQLVDPRSARGVEADRSRILDRPVLRLRVRPGAPPDAFDMDAALCRILVCTRIWPRAAGDPRAVPDWLAAGVAGNLLSARKAANSHAAYTRWRDGALPSPAVFLRAGKDAADGPVSGMLIGWLLDLPASDTRLAALFSAVAADGRVTSRVLAQAAVGRPDLAALDAEWDHWILRQRRMVYEPGTATAWDIEILEAELLLYPGSFGIPRCQVPGPVSVGELLEYRDASWLPVTVFSKVCSLRLAAVGRGPGLAAVVEGYVRFLEALDGAADATEPALLLAEAERELKALKRAMAVQ
jgi:hypothetical protein